MTPLAFGATESPPPGRVCAKVTMNKLVQVLGALAAAVLVLAIWRSPATAASDVGDVIGWLAGLVQEAVGRFADFLSSF